MAYVHFRETDDATGVTLKIIQDDAGAERPYDGDEAVKIVVLHRRYINPAKGEIDTLEQANAFERAAKRKGSPWYTLPLWLYDHSGTSYRAAPVNPFSCPWDSGRVGFVAIRKDEFHKAGKRKDFAKACKGIAEHYSDWANGNVWGYVIEDSKGEQLDSCWGFIGDPDGYVLEEAREAFASNIADANATQRDAIESARPDLYGEA